MSEKGNIEYKCRRCGVIYARASAPDCALALQCALNDFMEQPRGWGITIQVTDLHRCGERVWGVADLHGAVED